MMSILSVNDQEYEKLSAAYKSCCRQQSVLKERYNALIVLKGIGFRSSNVDEKELKIQHDLRAVQKGISRLSEEMYEAQNIFAH